MTRDDAIEKLKVEQTSDYREEAHVNADFILCLFLTSLGYSDVVKEYEKISKWYA